MKFFLFLVALTLPLAAQSQSTVPPAVATTATDAWLSGSISPYSSTSSALSRAYAKHLPPSALRSMGTLPAKALTDSTKDITPAGSPRGLLPDSLALYSAERINTQLREQPKSPAPQKATTTKSPHHHLTPYEYYMQELNNESADNTASLNAAQAALDTASKELALPTPPPKPKPKP